MAVKLPNMDERDDNGRIIIRSNPDELKTAFFERVRKTLADQSTEGMVNWARGWVVVPANPSTEQVAAAFSEEAQTQWAPPAPREVPAHFRREHRIGKHGNPGGVRFYKEKIHERETVIHSFIEQEANTSLDLLKASMNSGGSKVDSWKDLESSSINRISDALVSAYEIPDYKLGLALSALTESYVFSGSLAQETRDAPYRLGAARKLMATALATGSEDEVREAKFMLQAVYTTAWKIDKEAAGERASEDLQRIIVKIEELQRASPPARRPSRADPTEPAGPAAR